MLFQLLCTSSQVHPDPSCHDRLSRIKYCLRGLLTPRLTREWFRILAHPKLEVVARNQPHILSKLQRPYLHSAPGPWARLRALKSHYRFLELRLSSEAIQNIYSPKGLVLAQVSPHENCHIELRLGYHHSLSMEGDLVISVHDDGGILGALSFCVWKYEAKATQAFVGGLQSFRCHNQKERIVGLTRALNGLRPKALLFFALQNLAAVWDIDSIKAVSNLRHVYRHYRKRKSVAFSYDAFWIECGGNFERNGFFALPARWTPRDLSEMTASKRQLYRRRYVLLQELALQVCTNMAQYTLPVARFDPSCAEDPVLTKSSIDPALGVGQGDIVREHLERAKAASGIGPFMKLAGVLRGSKRLSRTKGLSSS